MTVRTVVASEYGEPADVLSVETVDAPEPAAGELAIDVRFASVNPVDWKLLSGDLKEMMPLDFPFRPGCDGAGEVRSVGAGVTGFAAGERVAFNAPIPECGAMAGTVTVAAETCAKIPDNVDFKLAAGLPVVAETAQQALFEFGGLEAGQTVLIHGASGAVGSCALQLAKRAGAAAICTASGANADFVRLLGADTFIDYKQQRFEDAVKTVAPDGVDLVLDTAGGETTDRSFAVLKQGGRLASVVQPPDDSKAERAGVTAEMILMKPDGDRLAGLLELAGEGRLSVEIADVKPLPEVAAALEKQKRGDFRGKLLIDCRDM